MTQENKELLLKDLCARLPYEVKVEITHWRNRDKGMIDSKIFRVPLDINKASVLIKPTSDIRPYLFPLSSMTEEQKKELNQIILKQTDILAKYMENCDWGINFGKYHFVNILEFNWLLKNHFDIYGLIPKGLAIDATGLNIY